MTMTNEYILGGYTIIKAWRTSYIKCYPWTTFWFLWLSIRYWWCGWLFQF